MVNFQSKMVNFSAKKKKRAPGDEKGGKNRAVNNREKRERGKTMKKWGKNAQKMLKNGSFSTNFLKNGSFFVKNMSK